eukprot:m.470988 g.470988  ORF g.470988 m.470988 type:complete len:254 (+) comp21657_c0_seq11:218-979(+)
MSDSSRSPAAKKSKVAPESSVAAGKKLAAYAAVDEVVKNNMVVGIGSGSTVVFAVERIAQRVKDERLQLRCVPTSYQALQLIRQHKLNLSDLSADPVIDVTIDGADEVDCKTLDCIKGGGGCHVQEKIVAFNSKLFVLICDDSKKSHCLGEKWTRGVPVEVIPIAAEPLLIKFRDLGGQPVLRMAKSKMGPLVTDNGNFVIDVDFRPPYNPRTVHENISRLAGVVDTGFFLGMAAIAFIGHPDKVERLEAQTA